MSLDLNIKIDKQDLADVKKMLRGIDDGAYTTLMRSINKAVTGGRTDVNREVRKVLNLKASRVKKNISIKKAGKQSLSAFIQAKGRPISLIQYGARQSTKKGVTVKVKKDSGRKRVPHAFIAEAKQGGPKVFVRGQYGDYSRHVGKGRPYRPGFPYSALPKKYRKPITVLRGPRVEDILDDPPVMKEVESSINDRLSKEMKHQVDYILNKYRGR